MQIPRQTINFQPRQHHKNYVYTPHLPEAVRNGREQQIKQHSLRSSINSPQKSLIVRTQQLLQYDPSPEKYGRTVENGMIASVDVRRGSAVGSARLRSRRDIKMNQTKKQLELLNQLYRENYSDQIKRYQKELEHEESEIHTTVAQYRLKRKKNPQKTSRGRYLRQIPQKPTISSGEGSRQLDSEARARKKDDDDMNMEVNFDRMHPYRRLLITRRRSKEPWVVSADAK